MHKEIYHSTQPFVEAIIYAIELIRFSDLLLEEEEKEGSRRRRRRRRRRKRRVTKTFTLSSQQPDEKE